MKKIEVAKMCVPLCGAFVVRVHISSPQSECEDVQ